MSVFPPHLHPQTRSIAVANTHFRIRSHKRALNERCMNGLSKHEIQIQRSCSVGFRYLWKNLMPGIGMKNTRVLLGIGAADGGPRWKAWWSKDLWVSKPLCSWLLLKRCQRSRCEVGVWRWLYLCKICFIRLCLYYSIYFIVVVVVFIHRYPSSTSVIQEELLLKSDLIITTNEKCLTWGPILLSSPQILHDQRFKSPLSLQTNVVPVVAQSAVG